MKNAKRYYYKFWLKSSRGTDQMTVRVYDYEPDEPTLKDNVEAWTECFPCTKVSENAWSYGWEEIDGKTLALPKDREECLKWHTAACEAYYKANDEKRLWAALLSKAPYNGSTEDC